MSFFNPNVDSTLRTDLSKSYEDMAYGGSYAAIIGIFAKDTMSGDSKKIVLKNSLNPGQSASAAQAVLNGQAGPNGGLAGRQGFTIPPFKCYGVSPSIPLDQAAFTKGDNAVVALLLDESKTAMDSAKMQLDQALASDGSGCTLQFVSHTGSGPSYTLVLAEKAMVNRALLNGTYQSKATPFAGSFDVGPTASFQITNITPSTLSITVTASNSWAPTDGHFAGLMGTVQASTAIVTWPGIPAWIVPFASRPISQSDNFFGVNRSVDETKLAGSAKDFSTGGNMLEGILELAMDVADVPGSNPDTILMSYQNKGKIVAFLQTQRRYVEGEIKGDGIDVFYKTVKISGGPKGDMDLVASSNWSSTLVAVLDKSTWKLYYPEGQPGPFAPASANGNPILEIPGTDTAMAMYRCSAVVGCEAPGFNGMLTVKA
jgi:hypothetical protein